MVKCKHLIDMNRELISGTSKRKVNVETKQIGKVEVYEVTKRELMDIEKGEHNSFWTGLCNFSISAGISFLTTYLTMDNTDTKTGGVIQAIFIIAFIIGVGSFYKSIRCKNELKELFNDIRNR